MQVLFESSHESPGAKGLGVIPWEITKFNSSDDSWRSNANGEKAGKGKSVPQIGWNGAWNAWEEDQGEMDEEDYYFVHSFAGIVPANSKKPEFAYTLSRYGSETFISSVRKGNVYGTQFHPEKSGPAGLELLRKWLAAPVSEVSSTPTKTNYRADPPTSSGLSRRFKQGGNGLTNRVVACLDVRSNDNGDLVVTKGDQYDVREKDDSKAVRNLGKPVALSQKYYEQGADEVCFLNITSFRSSALQDQPMLEVVRAAAETVFVPLTIGGGIKDTVDPDGTARSALEVAGAYFRSGADKVSIGSEAVLAVEELLERKSKGLGPTGKTGIETISTGYGSQAVVVSIDPKRVYIDYSTIEEFKKTPHGPCLITGETSTTRTKSEEKGKAWWYQCTISGGRATRDIDVIQLAQGVEQLGAGEILLNSVDRDGSGKGFDLDLINLVKGAVRIPVVSSSGAGGVGDFEEVFRETGTEAALAAGIFHRGEVGIDEVKKGLQEKDMAVRRTTVKA